MTSLLVKGARVIDPRNGTDEFRDIYITGGIIHSCPIAGEHYRVFDARGLIAVPGLVDLHVHFREPGGEYKEDIETGSRAAAHGGFTTVCCMPNTKPVLDNRDTVEFVDKRGNEAGFVNLLAAGALSLGQEGKELADYEGMVKANTLARKLLASGICALSEDGKTLDEPDLMRKAAKQAKKLGLCIMDHAQDSALSVGGIINRGVISKQLGVSGIPNCAEYLIVARDIAIARETGCHIHLQHISARESVELIRGAKREGLNITAETAPHYFALTDEAIITHKANAKMNPPLRAEPDRQAIIKGLCDGTIDAIATDHAPHSEAEKELPLEEAAFGIVGLETAFAIAYTKLALPGHLSLPRLIRLMSVNPSDIIGLKRGSLADGDPADLAVIDTNTPYAIDRNTFFSKGKNTPFHGMNVYGCVKLTVCGGKISWEE